MAEPNVASTNISALEERLRTKVEAFTRHRRLAAETAWEIGEILQQARPTKAHGEWVPWVEQFMDRGNANKCQTIFRAFRTKEDAGALGTFTEAHADAARALRIEDEAAGRPTRHQRRPANQPVDPRYQIRRTPIIPEPEDSEVEQVAAEAARRAAEEAAVTDVEEPDGDMTAVADEAEYAFFQTAWDLITQKGMGVFDQLVEVLRAELGD